MGKTQTKRAKPAIVLATVAALLAFLVSCATSPSPAPPENAEVESPASHAAQAKEQGRETNTAVFPELSDDVQSLLFHPGDSQDILTRWGDPVDPRIELIVDNALRHYQARQYAVAAQLWAYAVQYAADTGETLTREQLWNLIMQRAYNLVDSGQHSDVRAIWDYQVSMWQDGDGWNSALPAGLVVSTTESAGVAAYYLATSHAERSFPLAMSGDLEAAFNDITEAAEIYAHYGYAEQAIWYSLAFMNNAYSLGEYTWGIEVNPIVSDLMSAYPNSYTPDQVLQLGRLSAGCLINLGDIAAGYRRLQSNVSLAESMGYADQMTAADRSLMEEAKRIFPEKIRSGEFDLQDAVLAEDPDAVRALLEKDADPDRVFDGFTPLMILSRDSGDPAIGRLLLEAGANPNATGYNNGTALANAAGYTDNLQVVELLLEYGADPNISSPQGWTSLMLAVRRGSSPGIVKALLDAGADPSARAVDGTTALILAENGMNRNGDIARLLRDALE